jgi:hypothetical protein
LKGTDRFLVEGVVCTLNGVALPVSNLSVGGFFAATHAPPARGEIMEMELVLKGRPPFRVTGKVSWINEAEAPRASHLPQGFGFKIVRIALGDKIAIVDFLKRTSPAKLKGPAPPPA